MFWKEENAHYGSYQPHMAMEHLNVISATEKVNLNYLSIIDLNLNSHMWLGATRAGISHLYTRWADWKGPELLLLSQNEKRSKGSAMNKIYMQATI